MANNKPDYFKRNFSLGVINGTLVNFGMAFVDPYTVLPVFILRLGASNFIVGLISSIAGAGWYFPQLFISRIAESRRFLRGIYRSMTAMRILSWGGVLAVIFFVDPTRLGLFLIRRGTVRPEYKITEVYQGAFLVGNITSDSGRRIPDVLPRSHLLAVHSNGVPLL